MGNRATAGDAPELPPRIPDTNSYTFTTFFTTLPPLVSFRDAIRCKVRRETAETGARAGPVRQPPARVNNIETAGVGV